MAEFLQVLAMQNNTAFRDDQFQQCFLEGTVLAAGILWLAFCFVFFNYTSIDSDILVYRYKFLGMQTT